MSTDTSVTSESFYLWVQSNAPAPSGQKNQPQNFTIETQHHDQLQGKWEVALTEIQYPFNWFNVPEDVAVHFHHDRYDAYGVFQEGILGSITISAGRYKDITTLLTIFNEKFKAYFQNKNLSADKYGITMKVNPITERLESTQVNTSPTVFYPGFNSYFTDAGNEIHASTPNSIEQGENLFKMLGIELEEDWRKEKFFKADKSGQHQANVTLHSPALYVYCNFIDYQYVGNERAQLLRIVPMAGIHGDYTYMEFTNRQYLDLSTGYIKKLNFEIRDDTGKPVIFQAGKVTLALHFRPKRI